MNTKQEIIKNSEQLNEAEINYYKDKYTQIKAQESEAETILRQNENARDFIEQLNGMSEYKDRKDKDGKSIRGLTQFLDTEKQRDLLVSVWILANSRDKSKAEEFGINLKEPEAFDKELKKVISDTRKAAKTLEKKSPSQKEVEQVKSGETPEEEPEAEGTPEAEKDSESPKEPSEAPSFPPEKDDDEDEDDEDDEKQPESPKKEKSQEVSSKRGEDLVNTKDFPPPKTVASDFEKYQESKLKEIDQSFSWIKDPTKEQQARYDNAKSKIDKLLSSYKSKIMNKQRQYDVHPTRSSAMKSSTAAKKMASDARREVGDVVSKFKRSNMPGRVERTGMRLRDAGKAIGKGVGAVTGSRAAKVTGDALKSAAAKGSEMAKKGASTGKEAASSFMEKRKEKKAADAIEKYLDSSKRNEYLSLLQQGKAEEAEKIRQEGIEAKNKKDSESKQGKEQERLEKLKRQTQQENRILRYYGKKLNELADNPATREEEKEDPRETKEALKIAKGPLGKSGAEEYMKLMKGSAQEKKKAVDMLQKAEQEEEKTKDDLGLETKEQNEAVKRVLKSIMR